MKEPTIIKSEMSMRCVIAFVFARTFVRGNLSQQAKL